MKSKAERIAEEKIYKKSKGLLTQKQHYTRLWFFIVLLLGAIAFVWYMLDIFLKDHISSRFLNLLVGLISFAPVIFGFWGFFRYLSINLDKLVKRDFEQLIHHLLYDTDLDYRIAAAIRLGELKISASRQALDLVIKEQAHAELTKQAKIALEKIPQLKADDISIETLYSEEQSIGNKKKLNLSDSLSKQTSTILYQHFIELAKKGNVSEIEKIFYYAQDWATRELAVTALNSMITMKLKYNTEKMKQTLHGIIDICNAETSGGSYRTNCIRFAENSLEELQ